MNLMHSTRAARLVVLGVLALAGTAAGCGSDDPAEEAAPAAATAAAPAGGAQQQAAERLEVLERGLATQPPSEGPAAQAGKEVWAISCGDFAESCKAVTDATIEAGEALGWSMKRFDAKVDPARAADGIRQAIAAKADAVVVSSFDCTLLKSALAEAEKAKVLTYGSGASNCDDPVTGDGSRGLYTLVDVLPPDTGPGWSNWLRGWGADKANYAIAKTGGKAKAINLEETDIPNVSLISKGFDEQLGTCEGCEVVATVTFTGPDTTNNNLTQKLTNALTANPDADVVHMPVDGLLPNVAPAIAESGRTDDLLVIGGEGYPANLDAVREGGPQDAALAFDLAWESWSQMDDLNRRFAGEEPVYGGWGYSVVDRDVNLPASGGWPSKVDFRKAYRDVWGG